MDKKKTTEFVNTLYKNVKMGHDSLKNCIKKVEDKSLKTDLELQKKDYGTFITRLESIAEEMGISLSPENPVTKTMAQVGINIHTAFDASSSKIAEMVVQGSTMGIIDTTKAINNNNNSECMLKQLANDIVLFERNNVERMKNYL